MEGLSLSDIVRNLEDLLASLSIIINELNNDSSSFEELEKDINFQNICQNKGININKEERKIFYKFSILMNQINDQIGNLSIISNSIYEKFDVYEYENMRIKKEMQYLSEQNESLKEINLHDSMYINDLKIEISNMQRDYDEEIRKLKLFYEEKNIESCIEKEELAVSLNECESENKKLNILLEKYKSKENSNEDLLSKFDQITRELHKIIKENNLLHKEKVRCKCKQIVRKQKCCQDYWNQHDNENFNLNENENSSDSENEKHLEYNCNFKNQKNIDLESNSFTSASVSASDLDRKGILYNKINYISCETNACTYHRNDKSNSKQISNSSKYLNINDVKKSKITLLIENNSFSIIKEKEFMDLNSKLNYPFQMQNIYEKNFIYHQNNDNNLKTSNEEDLESIKDNKKNNYIPLEDLFNDDNFYDNFENQFKDPTSSFNFSNCEKSTELSGNENFKENIESYKINTDDKKDKKKSVLIDKSYILYQDNKLMTHNSKDKDLKTKNNITANSCNNSDPLKDFFMLSFMAYKLNNIEIAELEENCSTIVSPHKLFQIATKINLPFHKYSEFINNFYIYLNKKKDKLKKEISNLSSKKPSLIHSIFGEEEIKNHLTFKNSFNNNQNQNENIDKNKKILSYNIFGESPETMTNSLYNEYTNECVKNNYISSKNEFVNINEKNLSSSSDNQSILSKSIKSTKNYFSKFFNI